MKDASLDDFLTGGSTDDSIGEGDDSADVEVDVDEGETSDGDGSPSTRDDSSAGDGERADDEERADDGDGTDDEECSEDGERTPTTSRIESVTPTMIYAPDGATCEGCGATVERRWQAESGRYCAACVKW